MELAKENKYKLMTSKGTWKKMLETDKQIVLLQSQVDSMARNQRSTTTRSLQGERRMRLLKKVDDRSSLAQFAKLNVFKLTCCAQQEKRRKTIPNLSGHDERMHVGGPIKGGRAAAAVARRRTVVRRRRRRGASVPRPKVPRARTDVRATAVVIITITHRLVSLSLSVTIPLPGRLWFRPCRHN